MWVEPLDEYGEMKCWLAQFFDEISDFQPLMSRLLFESSRQECISDVIKNSEE
jgi:hypothetical protein